MRRNHCISLLEIGEMYELGGRVVLFTGAGEAMIA